MFNCETVSVFLVTLGAGGRKRGSVIEVNEREIIVMFDDVVMDDMVLKRGSEVEEHAMKKEERMMKRG